MTPSKFIELMRKAGAETQDDGQHWEYDDFNPKQFAALIEVALLEAYEKEREDERLNYDYGYSDGFEAGYEAGSRGYI